MSLTNFRPRFHIEHKHTWICVQLREVGNLEQSTTFKNNLVFLMFFFANFQQASSRGVGGASGTLTPPTPCRVKAMSVWAPLPNHT